MNFELRGALTPSDCLRNNTDYSSCGIKQLAYTSKFLPPH